MAKTFEDFLEDRHAAQTDYMVLDDDMPDHFDAWVSELDSEEIMKYAEDYGKLVYLEGKIDALKEAQEIVEK